MLRRSTRKKKDPCAVQESESEQYRRDLERMERYLEEK